MTNLPMYKAVMVWLMHLFQSKQIYRILSNRTAGRFQGGKAVVWGGCIRNNTKMAVSQPKMVRFSICKRGFEEKIVLYESITSEYSWGGSIGGAVIMGRIRYSRYTL